jgi:hypothetical protein
MRKIILLFVFTLFLVHLFAQSEEPTFERRGHGTFFELGGAGFSYTFNYESRFGESNRGLGARVGIGFSSLSDISCFTLPVHINYLLGKKDGKHYLEIGAGYTYIDLREMDDYRINDELIYFEGTSFASFSLMYHRHPPLGGFLWKIGFTPLVGDFSDGRSFVPHFGLAFGYAF